MAIKQAYIELKNRDNFEIFSIGVSDVLYHGTVYQKCIILLLYNKIIYFHKFLLIIL